MLGEGVQIKGSRRAFTVERTAWRTFPAFVVLLPEACEFSSGWRPPEVVRGAPNDLIAELSCTRSLRVRATQSFDGTPASAFASHCCRGLGEPVAHMAPQPRRRLDMPYAFVNLRSVRPAHSHNHRLRHVPIQRTKDVYSTQRGDALEHLRPRRKIRFTS